MAVEADESGQQEDACVAAAADDCFVACAQNQVMKSLCRNEGDCKGREVESWGRGQDPEAAVSSGDRASVSCTLDKTP